METPLVAAYVVAKMGYFATFAVAASALALAGLIIHCTWEENCGTHEGSISRTSRHIYIEFPWAWLKGFMSLLLSRDVILLGLIQAAADTCMYTFAFTSLRYFTEGNYYREG